MLRTHPNYLFKCTGSCSSHPHGNNGISFTPPRKAAKSWLCVCPTQGESADSSPRLSSAENEADQDEVGLTEPKKVMSVICFHEVTGSFLGPCFCLQASSFSNLEDDCDPSQQGGVHLPCSFPHTSQESERTASCCPVWNFFCHQLCLHHWAEWDNLPLVSLQVQDIPAHRSKAASQMKMTVVRGRARLSLPMIHRVSHKLSFSLCQLFRGSGRALRGCCPSSSSDKLGISALSSTSTWCCEYCYSPYAGLKYTVKANGLLLLEGQWKTSWDNFLTIQSHLSLSFLVQ